MKSKESKEKPNLNQTQPINKDTIELYRKFSMPNLLPSKKKAKFYGRVNDIMKKIRLDSSKTLNIDGSNPKLVDSNKNNQNSKIFDSGQDAFKIRKINIKKSTQMFNYFYDNKKSDINKGKNIVNTNINNNIGETVEHKLLYEDIIKLKNKINKLKKELLFLKSMSRKRDEDIKELENYQEDAKFYFGKEDFGLFYQKVAISKEIIKLKNKYESIKIKCSKQKDINDDLAKQIKLLDLSTIINNNNENRQILLDKTIEYMILRKQNEELENKLINFDWVKHKYDQNHTFVLKCKHNVKKKLSKIEKMRNVLEELEERYKKTKLKQNQMLRRNLSIIGDNKKLLEDKKNREEYIIRQTEIEKQISLYEMKTRNLINETNDKENIINNYLRQNNTEWRTNDNITKFEFKPILEQNPNELKNKNIILYESLIQESKQKQKELINNILILIENTKDEIKNKKNISKNNEENNYINNNFYIIGSEDNSQLFSNTENINAGIKEIHIEDHGEITKKNNNFILLLNVLFYIKNISQRKIENILLNFKTEKYYTENFNKKKDFLTNLSTEILRTIDNINDINNLKEVLSFLLDNKYQGKNGPFLDKVISDIYFLNDKTKMLLNKNEEKNMIAKLRKIFSEKNSNLIIEKINKNKNRNNISYENLKKVLKEEKIFKQKKENEKKLLQFFIYFIKKKENLTQNYSLNEFTVTSIINFIIELNKKEGNNFIVALKNLLDNKNITLEAFLGTQDVISISKFVNILNKNDFKTQNNNLDIYGELQKYQIGENSNNININKLKKDLDEL